ncbi:MAG TPA: gamma carbonic anhydrase family protein [Longimicrobiaceae bacterium]|nr:gamma carbonic anhydrase family protein [Longimicrobiaceae bacterium]
MATIFELDGLRPRVHPTAWVAPTATIIGNVVIGADATVWFGAVLRGDDPEREIRVGARTSVQDNCVLHVSAAGPTVVGEGVTLGHGAVLESCRVEDGALIGMNAVVLQGAVVEAGALVAAGAVVAGGSRIPARHLAAGAPAKVKKPLPDEALRAIAEGAEHYVEAGGHYRSTLRSLAERPRSEADG